MKEEEEEEEGWLSGAMFDTLIGSLLQCSCLFISRPVNNLPASISVILHLSLTLSPIHLLPSSWFSHKALHFFLSLRSYKNLSTESSSLHPSLIPSVTFSHSRLITQASFSFITSRHPFSFPKSFLTHRCSEYYPLFFPFFFLLRRGSRAARSNCFIKYGEA